MSARAFDVVVAAGGRQHAANTELLTPVSASGLLDGQSLTVDSCYRVNFRREALAAGCGLWMLGSLEEAKVRDDALSFMAERGERAVSSVIEAMEREDKAEQRFGELAML